MTANKDNDIRRLLLTIGSDELSFLLGRYESASMLQDLIDDVMLAELDALVGNCAAELDIPGTILAIADTCVEDGADWGEIPCLGGHARDVWEKVLQLAVP